MVPRTTIPATARISRRHASLAIAMVLAATGWQSSAARAQPTEVKVGISTPANTVLALWMAQAAGFYDAQNLKVSITNMGGGSRGAEALRTGGLDVMHVGLSSVVQLNKTGGDLRTIASLANVIRFGFFTQPSVKTAAALKGGTIAISAIGSESDATVTMALRRLSLTRNDVTLKEFGDSRKRLDAVKSGAVTATTLNEPFASAARDQGLNLMVDLATDRIPWLFSTLVVRRNAIAEKRDVLTRFLKATIEGNYLALSNPKRAKAVLIKETGIGDPKIVDISYDDFVQMTPPNAEPVRAGADNILALFPPEVSRNFDDYVDLAILEGLHKDGTLATFEQKYGKR
jgi:ABC-type nitrate/sulfonate/bicarbonate transport system substrate-binding protein